MQSQSKIKVTAIITTVMLIAITFVAFRQITLNDDLSSQISTEKLKSEKMLSEKLKLEKEIKEFKAKLASYQGKNEEMDKVLVELKTKLDEKEKALARMSKSEATARAYQKESESLKGFQDELNAKIELLTKENSRLTAQLAEADRQIASLNTELARKSVVTENVMTGNYRIETIKKNEKLTVRAKKTGKMAVSFDAESFETGDDFTMVVRAQSGKDVKGKLAYYSSDIPSEMMADAGSLAPQRLKKRVQLEFAPKEKMNEGIFSIIVYRGTEEIGMAQIRLSR